LPQVSLVFCFFFPFFSTIVDNLAHLICLPPRDEIEYLAARSRHNAGLVFDGIHFKTERPANRDVRHDAASHKEKYGRAAQILSTNDQLGLQRVVSITTHNANVPDNAATLLTPLSAPLSDVHDAIGNTSVLADAGYQGTLNGIVKTATDFVNRHDRIRGPLSEAEKQNLRNDFNCERISAEWPMWASFKRFQILGSQIRLRGKVPAAVDRVIWACACVHELDRRRRTGEIVA
jgi:hypothetical protein